MRVPPLRLNHVVSGLILLLCGAAVLWHGFVTGAWAWGLVFGALVPAVGLTQIYKLVYMPTRIDVGEVLVATLALAVAGTSADALEAVAARATGIETRVDP